MKVTLAYPLTVDHDGKSVNHRPDSTVDLEEQLALDLLADGRARVPEDDKTTTKKES